MSVNLSSNCFLLVSSVLFFSYLLSSFGLTSTFYWLIGYMPLLVFLVVAVGVGVCVYFFFKVD